MSTFLERQGDRINPILVKEVRAALRGRWFKTSFAIVLCLATIASMGYVMFAAPEGGAASGPAYFAIVLGCMGLALHGLVPFSAMLSMNAESDEHTLELLQISGIPTARIVLGKLFAALIQAGLVLSAFLPFLTFAFLLRGVGAGQIAVTLVGSIGACAAQCSFGILLGSLAKARWARVLFMFLFAFFLLQTSGWGVMLAMMFALVPGAGGAATTGSAVTFLVFFAATVFFAVIAASRLAHPEENQSTPMRVSVTLVLVLGLALVAFQGSLGAALTVAGVTLGFVAIPLIFVVTERERLPRAVAAHLPRWSRIAPLQAWLPGGGRGALYLVLNLGAFVAVYGILVFARFGGGLGGLGSVAGAQGNFASIASVVLLAIVFLGLPSALLARFLDRGAGRAAARILVPALLLLSVLLPLFLGFLIGQGHSDKWLLLSIPDRFNPNGTPVDDWGPVMMWMCALSVLALIANVPRVVRSYAEVRSAREREGDAEVARAATES
jgi:hypothetical protein